MPAFTPNLNLYLPGGGSAGTITPDEVVDIDRINQNMRLIDTAVGDIRTSQSKLSDTQGLVLIKPVSVTGAGVSVDALGHIDLGNQETVGVTINGVFTTDYRAYLVICEYITTGGANGSLFRLANGGVADSGGLYWTQTLAAIGTGMTAEFSNGDRISGAPTSSNYHTFELQLFSPGQANQFTRYKLEEWSNGGAGGLALRAGTYEGLKAFDGLRLELSSTGTGRRFDGGRISIFGYK